ncbi:MAG: translation initiation factor IF-2 [Phycisphaerales bacterium]|nr:translation initiation factor IF-2 [Phycisphaerales bacterium]MDP7520486.1 translation initiation factor IF-2 [Phycisphaerales bacterium]
MAKKVTTIRVHQIAKELGVASKDVVAKCGEEGVPNITNHMSAISFGLAATIREWFDDSATGSTAVQTAAPVDIKQARAKAKKKVRKTTTKKASAKAAVKEPPADIATPAPEPPPSATRGTGLIEPPSRVPPPEVPSNQPEEKPATKAIPNEPERPEKVEQLGRKLEEPKKSQLSGPKVIRVEQPENIRPPRPKGPPRSSPDKPSGGPNLGGPPPPDATDRGRPSRRNRRRTGTADRGTDARDTKQQQGASVGQRNWREQDLREREQRLSRSGGYFRSVRRDSAKRASGPTGTRAKSAVDLGGEITLPEPLTIKSMSAASGVKARDILRWLVSEEHDVTINSTLPPDVAVDCMLSFGVELEVVEAKTAEQQIAESFTDRDMKDERPRSPVVTILGHVDHGKTSLLDSIRNASVAEGEAGGITQATSAFRVPVTVGDDEHLVTFIDTPGHEAFTEMRARGAKVTDIVVLVVAADDGVMPQTIESINHAKAAGVPIVVALNKVDKPEATDANIQRILGQLAEHELNPVEWGGDTEVVKTTAIKGEGISDLLEILDLQAQLLELTADFDGPAEGTVLEAQLQEGRGAVASILVQQGQLKKGDYIVAGRGFGRVRDIVDDHGDRTPAALPSDPVTISGIGDVPDAGDQVFVVKNLREAETAAKERVASERQRSLTRERVTLDNILDHMSEAGKKELPIILKADVQGSVETIMATLAKMTNDEVRVSIKHAAVGGISESDVSLADASAAIIIGFNVTASGKVRRAADDAGVDIRYYDVIYDITDDIEKAIVGMLEPEHRMEILGHAEVREVFRVSKVGMVAGCYVTSGSIQRSALIRVTRDDIVIENDRKLSQLKRFKDDAKEVKSGQECGMLIDGYDDIKVGDVLECYVSHEVRPGA